MHHVLDTSSAKRVLAIVLITLVGLGSLVLARPAGADATLSIYDDQINTDWSNYSWNADIDMSSYEHVHGGESSLQASLDPWGAVYLSTTDQMQAAGGAELSPDSTLEFALYADEADTVLFLQVVDLAGTAGPVTEILATPGQWQVVSLPMTDLTSADAISGLWWQNASTGSRSIALDDITISRADDQGTAPTPEPTPDPGDAVDPTNPSELGRIIYDDAWGPDVLDYSWSIDALPSSTGQVASGTNALHVEFDVWGGLYAAASETWTLPQDAILSFSVYPVTLGPVLGVEMTAPIGESTGLVELVPAVGTWTRYDIPVDDLGAGDEIAGFWIQSLSGDLQTMYIDDIIITGTRQGTDPAQSSGGDGPALSISLGDATVVRSVTDPNSGETLTTTVNYPHAISDGIYGLNFAAPTLVSADAGLDIAFNRWGGNATARYNHETGSGVIGFDYFFMTDPGTQGSDHTWENENQAAGMDSLLTIPISGWVSKGTEPSCGYPLPEWGPVDESQPHWLDADLLCGNGERDGEVIPGDPTNTSKPVDTSFVQNWVEEMVATHGPAAAGGVENYALDNEPNLWAHTHSDMRSAPIPRDELFDRNVDYATAIKQGDPTAGVYGPVLWGGFSYFQTNDEFEQGLRPDAVPNLVDDYLTTMREASDKAGTRLLDALSVNFYDDRSFTGGTAEYRLQSTRSLWDPTWAPEDWWLIRDFVGGEALAVIPRLQAQIAQSYPGTDLAITEYNFGSLDTIDGALAQADALGVFGREGVDVATLWDPFSPELNFDEPGFVNKPAYWAYRMYRNADGEGERFGDRALFAETDDYDTVSIYAGERTSDGAITIMLVNKSREAQQSQLALDGVSGLATVYEYAETDLDAIRQLDPIVVDGDATVALAPWSITMLVIG